MDISLTEAALYALDRLALAILIGCGATGAWLVADDHQRRMVTPALRGLAGIALLLLTITTTIVLLLRSAALADVGITEVAPYLPKVISSSAFGTFWLARLAVLIVMIVVWLVSQRGSGSRADILFITGGAITAFCISATSHAGDEGAFTFDNFINTVHIIGGCLWGGAIIAFVWMRITMRRYATPAIAESAVRLSTLATVALVTVITTGLINGWNRFELLSELWTSDYGITLIVKLGFVATMMTIGALNRFYVVPAIVRMQSGASQRLLRLLYIDTLLFLLVISSAAALGMQSPSH
ncbi:MAG: CopD family protein [Pseudomonadota bacterium]|nr:CopD family protein [Pseudomonadota bacterium]